MKKGYTFIITGRDLSSDGKISPEYITDDTLRLFKSKEDAFNAALTSAENEVNDLCSDCDSDRSFGIPEDNEYQSKDEVKVCCYFDDDTTELVTRRTIRQIVC